MIDPSTADFLAALRAVTGALEEDRSLIIGGVAVIALGVARYTGDVDATIWSDQLDVRAFVESLQSKSITPRIEAALEFAQRSRVLLLRHEPSGVSIDLSLAALPFEEEAIRSGRRVDFAGVSIRIPRPEDLVIYKLVAARPQDQKDVEQLMVLHRESIDIERVRSVIGEFSGLLEGTDRADLLETLWKRTAP